MVVSGLHGGVRDFIALDCGMMVIGEQVTLTNLEMLGEMLMMRFPYPTIEYSLNGLIQDLIHHLLQTSQLK